MGRAKKIEPTMEKVTNVRATLSKKKANAHTPKNSLLESLSRWAPDFSSAFETAYAKHDHKKFEEKYGVGRGKAFNIDVLYLMDCTSSMTEWINECKEKVSQVSREIQKNYPSSKLRQSFIGYRDYSDVGAVMKLDFVEESDVKKLQDFMRPIQAIGGRDLPEDIAPALKAATNLSWVSNKKLVIHFADAPCHGRTYHNLSGDDYPAGSPTGYDPKDYLVMLRENEIDYYFVKVGGGKSTEKMVDIFRNEYDNTEKNVNFMEFDASDHPEQFLPIVQSSISQSITYCR